MGVNSSEKGKKRKKLAAAAAAIKLDYLLFILPLLHLRIQNGWRSELPEEASTHLQLLTQILLPFFPKCRKTFYGGKICFNGSKHLPTYFQQDPPASLSTEYSV